MDKTKSRNKLECEGDVRCLQQRLELKYHFPKNTCILPIKQDNG